MDAYADAETTVNWMQFFYVMQADADARGAARVVIYEADGVTVINVFAVLAAMANHDIKAEHVLFKGF